MCLSLMILSWAFVLQSRINMSSFNSSKNSVISSPTSSVWESECFKEAGQTAGTHVLYWQHYSLQLTPLVTWFIVFSSPNTVLPTLSSFPIHTSSFFPHPLFYPHNVWSSQRNERQFQPMYNWVHSIWISSSTIYYYYTQCLDKSPTENSRV